MSSTKPMTRNSNVTNPERQPLLKSNKKENEQPPPEQLPPAVGKAAVHGLAEQANRKAPPPETPPLLDRDVVRHQPTPTTVAYSANGQTVEITMEEDQNGGATDSGQPGSNANTNVGRAPNYGTVVTNQPTSRVGAANLSNDVVNQALVDFMQGLGYPNLTDAVLNNPNDISLTNEVKEQLTEIGQDTLCRHLNSLKKTLLHERYSASYMPTGASLRASVNSALEECVPDFQQALASKTAKAIADIIMTNGSYVYEAATPLPLLVSGALLWGAMGACGTGAASTVNRFIVKPVVNGLRSQILGGDFRLVLAEIDRLLPSPCNIDPSTGRKLSNLEFQERIAKYNQIKEKVKASQSKALPHKGPQAILLNTALYGGIGGIAALGISEVVSKLVASKGVAAAASTGVVLGSTVTATAGIFSGLIQHEILSNKTINIPAVNEKGEYDESNPKSMCMAIATDVLPSENPENESFFMRSYELTRKDVFAGRASGTFTEVLNVLSSEAQARIKIAMAAAAIPTIIRPFEMFAQGKIALSELSPEQKDQYSTMESLLVSTASTIPGVWLWPAGLYKHLELTTQGVNDESSRLALKTLSSVKQSARDYLAKDDFSDLSPEENEAQLGMLYGGLEHYRNAIAATENVGEKLEVDELKDRIWEKITALHPDLEAPTILNNGSTTTSTLRRRGRNRI